MEPFESSSQIAQKTWELENNIIPIDATFFYDAAVPAKLQQEKPWSHDPHYFKRVKISALALLKMVVHARSGGTLEVMGFLQGKPDGDAIIVMDAFATPVKGTETEFNAQANAYKNMLEYIQNTEQARRLENLVGWYHSHLGYGCCLSRTDVWIQRINQKYQDPFLTVVVDPTRTISAGKVDIGAFRTYPEGYEPPDNPASQYQIIPPLNNISDDGVHCKQYYYSLDISYFKSSLDCHLLDLLWDKYWESTLSFSPFFRNKDYVAGQISDLADKLRKQEARLSQKTIGPSVVFKRTKEEESQIRRDSTKISVEQIHVLMSQMIKDILFNSAHRSGGSSGDPSGPKTE